MRYSVPESALRAHLIETSPSVLTACCRGLAERDIIGEYQAEDIANWFSKSGVALDVSL